MFYCLEILDIEESGIMVPPYIYFATGTILCMYYYDRKKNVKNIKIAKNLLKSSLTTIDVL